MSEMLPNKGFFEAEFSSIEGREDRLHGGALTDAFSQYSESMVLCRHSEMNASARAGSCAFPALWSKLTASLSDAVAETRRMETKYQL